MTGVECDGWEAWYNRMPGANHRDLHVAGTCHLPSGSMVVSLDLEEVEPERVVLRLTATTPGAGGTTQIDVRTVSWQADVGPDVKRVQIIGDAEAELDVGLKE